MREVETYSSMKYIKFSFIWTDTDLFFYLLNN